MNYLTSGNDAVDRIGMMNLTGNIIPQIWYKTIVGDTGKPHYLAIAILADIVYWYRPTEIRDERSGQIIGWKKKFQGDMLQRNYESIASQFGESAKTVTRAIVVLEKLGVVKRHRQTIQLKTGLIVNNVLFLELNPERLNELTFPSVEIMDERIENQNCTEWTNLSNRSDKNVQDASRICPESFPKMSEGADKIVRNASQDCPKRFPKLSERLDKTVRTNTKNIIETTINNTTENTLMNDGEIRSIHLSGNKARQVEEQALIQSDATDEIEAYTSIIRKNIEYDVMMSRWEASDREIYHELYEIICDIVCVKREKIRIGGEDYPYQLVKSRFLKLNSLHLEYVMHCMKETNTKIGNIRSYLITALYNAPNTMNHYYKQLVQHDMYG